MSSWIQILAVMGALGMFGCDSTRTEYPEHPDGTVLLTWRQFDGAALNDPQEARYVLNGKQIGRGYSGFLEVIEAVRNLPHGTELWVYPDKAVLLKTGDSTDDETPGQFDLPETVPFR